MRWRNEILFAQDHLNLHVRSMLMKMLEWQVGIQTNFSVSTGKSGKYLEKYLSKHSWNDLLSTYADGSYEGTWKALLGMAKLFRRTALYVADHFLYEYPHEDALCVTEYLKHVQHLSPDATKIY
ncbi:streptomycin adenylyltransferase [Hazenella coriacea]|uniref:Streptomycin adenylyltransferase n=1 Tax=Hazenella coriacea TaxID=1179467 RepID=A0A4R3L2M9_9BACL|nr:aminoglycoside 6-adenylyltransferase [Hazenella coriacea]TCS93833.1 streptomycin adenylyltransferase [Hazenella coriacea]